MIRAMIVDDEPLVRERVQTLLAAHPDILVVGECSDGLSALDAFHRVTPDVVFLDIQMPGLSGMEVAQVWRKEGRLPAIIFVTAYDQYAIEAFRLQALDYVMKPIDPDRFNEALARVREVLVNNARGVLDHRLVAILEKHERQQHIKPHIFVREGERYLLIRTADIRCIEATGNYSCLHCEKSQHLLRGTLSTLEATLDPQRFLRTHRSWIVNLDHVREAHPWGKGTWVLLLSDDQQVPVSTQYREQLLSRLIGDGQSNK